MRKYFKNIKQSFRFTRWSRNAYGAFSSLHRVVTIGRLRKEIVEASMLKQDSLSSSNSVCQILSSDLFDDERDEKALEFLDLLELIGLKSLLAIFAGNNQGVHQPRPRLSIISENYSLLLNLRMELFLRGIYVSLQQLAGISSLCHKL